MNRFTPTERNYLGLILSLFIILLCLSACGEVPQTDKPAAAAQKGTRLPDSAAIEQKETAVLKAVNTSGSMRRVAYFTSWSAYARGLEVKDLDPSLLTHINFAFANLNQSGEICVGDSWVDIEKPFSGDSQESTGSFKGHFGQLQRLKADNPDIQILISVGGWTWSGNFSATAATKAGRKSFADSAVKFLTQYGFDGVDIDWEFPVEGGNGIEHRAEDRENYTLLLKEVRSALDSLGTETGRHYLLTIAGGPNPSFTANTQIKEIMNSVDFINVMAYDYHGSWESVTGHNAPLYSNDGLSVSDTIEAYLSAGAEPGKLNLGLAFYGRGWAGASGASDGPGHAASSPNGTGYGLGTWESAVFDYWDLEQNYVKKNGYTRYFDTTARVPYLYNGSVFISYDDPESIREKLSFAAQKNLGGVMFWDFSGDKEKKLQRLICDFNGLSASEKSGGQAAMNYSSHQEISSSLPPQWESRKVYTGGEIISHNGIVYQAKWWTENQEPSANSQEWDPWEICDQ